MLDNYEKDSNGVIFQKDREPFLYDYSYADNYNTLPTNDIMSHLRLGYIVGSLGKMPESILDVGYGNGAFLNLAKNYSKCYGHDISHYPIPEGVEFVKDISEKHFDVITFFDVLEHFPNPYFLENLNCNYIVCSLPHCYYFSDEWFENWKHRKPNEHLWHFNQESLIRFFDAQGYSEVNTSNFEDIVRKNKEEYSNILSGVFKKR
jgi:hypothetical protein